MVYMYVTTVKWPTVLKRRHDIVNTSLVHVYMTTVVSSNFECNNINIQYDFHNGCMHWMVISGLYRAVFREGGGNAAPLLY